MAVGLSGTAGFEIIEGGGLPAMTAAQATQDYPIFVAPKACLVSAVSITPATAVTGVNTNTRHLNLDIPDGTEVATVDYVNGTDEVTMTPRALYSSASGTAMAAGGVMAIENEKIGNGIALPNYYTRIKLQWK